MSIYYAGIGARGIGPEVERFFKGLGKFCLKNIKLGEA